VDICRVVANENLINILHFDVTDNEIICMQIFDKSELKFLKTCQKYSVQKFCRFNPLLFNWLRNFYASAYRPSVPNFTNVCVIFHVIFTDQIFLFNWA
jgi:hypothetical protein